MKAHHCYFSHTFSGTNKLAASNLPPPATSSTECYIHIWDSVSKKVKDSHYLVYQLDGKVTTCYHPLSMSNVWQDYLTILGATKKECTRWMETSQISALPRVGESKATIN